MKLKTYFFYFISLYLFSLLAIFFNAPFGESIEYGIYYSYAWSVISDGDLNLINQLPANFSWLTTMTYSDVDFHDYGNVVLLTPFFYLFSLFKPHSLEMGVFMERSFILFNIFMAGVWINYLSKSIRLVLRAHENFLLPSFLFLCNSGLLWYLFFQTGGSDIINGTLMTWLIYKILQHQHDQRPVILFSLIFLALLFTLVKITFVFYLPLLLYLLYQNPDKEYVRNFFLFSGLSLLLIYTPHFFYNLRKFGFLYSGYYQSFNSQLFVLKGTLFSQNGYLVSSPIYWLSLVGIFLIVKDRKIKSLNFLLFTFLLFAIKIILVSFRQIEDELFGPRMIMIDSFLFAALFAYSYQRISRQWLVIFVACCSAFHLFNNTIYYATGDAWNAVYNFDTKNIALAFQNYRHQLSPFSLKEYFLNNLHLIPASLLLTLTTYGYSVLKESKRLPMVAMMAVISYLSIQTLHHSKLETNIAQLKAQGFYQDKVVGNGPAIYYYDDLISIYKKSIFYAEERGNLREAEIRRKHLNDYYQTISQEVLVDSIGFLEDLQRGHYRETAHWR